MRIIKVFSLTRFILLSLFLLCSGQSPVFAQTTTTDKTKEIPPWMENVDKAGGRSTYLVPKGAKIEQITADHMFIEPPNEYAARRFFELEKRQVDMEKELEEIKNELEEIREQCAIQQQSPSEKIP